MRPLWLDFRRERSFADTTIALVFLVCGATTTVFTLSVYMYINQQAVTMHMQAWKLQNMFQRKVAAFPERRDDSVETRQAVARANVVLQALNLPWSELFSAIEISKGESIALLAITPDAQQRTFRVSGEGKHVQAVLDYVKRLEQRDMLENVYLSNHEVALQDPQKPIRFTVAGSWRSQR